MILQYFKKILRTAIYRVRIRVKIRVEIRVGFKQSIGGEQGNFFSKTQHAVYPTGFINGLLLIIQLEPQLES